MISSMTGYARHIATTEWGEISWVLRSLNFRSLETQMHIPDMFYSVESRCRQTLAERFHRGKIEASLEVRYSHAKSPEAQLDDDLLKSLLDHANRIQERVPDAPGVSVSDILRWPGLVNLTVQPDEHLFESVLESLKLAADRLLAERQREGAQIADIMRDKLESVNDNIAKAQQLVPEAQQQLQDRFAERLGELEAEVDPDRLAKEIAIVTVKLDTAEEIERIKLHALEFHRVLEQESVVGKRLSFLLQELTREVNTLGSKTNYFPLNALAVEMKVLLEQMREQVQNLQ